MNEVLDNNGATSQQSESEKCAAEKHTVNRMNLASERERESQSEGGTHAIRGNQVGNTVAITRERRKMSECPSIRVLNDKLLPANYAAEKTSQRVIAFLKNHNKTGISRLPSPWRKKFQSFSINDKEFLFMDNRFVIPQLLRLMISVPYIMAILALIPCCQ